jgi:hypothetical protein
MSFLKKIFGQKEQDPGQDKKAPVDTDLSDFNMFMDGGTDRQDTDLNELSEHLNFISGGANTFKRRL